MDRLPGLLHLDGRHRGAASRLRVRPQGAGAPPRRGAAADRADQRADVGRPFRPVDPGRHGDVPPRAGAGRRRRGVEPAMRGAARRPRSTPASAISRRSSSWSGPASRRARRSTPPCSRPPARRSPVAVIRRHAGAVRAIHVVLDPHDAERAWHGRSSACAAMTARSPWPNRNSNPLADFSGTLVLVGAGKMGGAMLEGWLALGLDAEEDRRARAAAVERDRGAGRRAACASIPPRRGRRGVGDRGRGEAADRARGDAAARAARRRHDRRGLDHGRARRSRFLEERAAAARAIVRAMPNTPAAIGRGITVAVPTRGSSPPQRELAHRAAGGDRRGRMGRRRGADGRGDRGVGLGPGLCVPARRGDGAGRRRRRPAGRRWPRGSRARPSRARASCCTARRSMPRRCGRT